MNLRQKPALIETVCKHIEDDGFAVIDDAFNSDMTSALLEYLIHSDVDQFKLAGVGRKHEFHTNESIRNDRIMWLDPEKNEIKDYFDWIESLRTALNKNFYLGLHDYECMFAHYPTNASYQKHVDAFKNGKNDQNRKLSTILYLNQNWHSSDGGELLLYHHGDDQPFRSILPEMGRLVIFLSEEFPHEVLPARTSRFSLTGWFKTLS